MSSLARWMDWACNTPFGSYDPNTLMAQDRGLPSRGRTFGGEGGFEPPIQVLARITV